jgi:hypothetical protein
MRCTATGIVLILITHVGDILYCKMPAYQISVNMFVKHTQYFL